MDFTAIDFETATGRPDSACQLAAVRVRSGQIVETAQWLIRPRPLRFDSRNIAIHGITPAMVREAMEFGQLWHEIQRAFGEDCLIAHNASFDLGVLMACLITHDQPVPTMSFSCTRAIARRAWPQQPRFGLKPLADWLGIRFRHHDALEDSIACAKIAIAAAEGQNASSLEDLESKLKLSRGEAGPWGKRGPTIARSRTRSVTQSRPVAPSPLPLPLPGPTSVEPTLDLQRFLIRAEFIRPLSGRRIVFTGTLCRLQREEAEMLAARSGGTCQSNVTGQTDLVIVGHPDSRTVLAGRDMSAKEAKARELAQSGRPIEFMTEEQFLALIGG